MRISITDTVLITAFFLAFFPFVSPYPTPTDLQPLFFLMAALAILAKRGAIKCEPVLWLIPISVLSVVFFKTVDAWTIKEFGRLSCAIIALAFFYNFGHRINQKTLLCIAITHGLFVFWHFLDASSFSKIFDSIVRVIKIDKIGYRGASGLAPEPGFAGAISVLTIVFACFLKEFRGDRSFVWTIAIISIVTIFLTRSGSGALYLILFLFAWGIQIRRAPWLAVVSAVAVTGVFSLNAGRATDSVTSLLQEPLSTLKNDSSIGMRAMNISVGALTVIEDPFGHGFGEYDEVANEIVNKYEIDRYINGYVEEVSAFATYSVMAGILWWVTLVGLHVIPIVKLGYRAVPYIGMAGILLLSSYSVAFPLTWGLIGVSWSRAFLWWKWTGTESGWVGKVAIPGEGARAGVLSS